MMRATCVMVGLALILAGGAGARAEEDRSDSDPWEGFNRAIFTFNDAADRWVIEPVAKGYDVIAPDPLQRCFANFFHNLRVPINGVNDLLQGKPVDGASDVGRFVVNSTIGMAGFLDPATYFGLVRHDEDFGQTLGVWGVPQGPYLVLPLLGPSTVRDTGGRAVDAALTPTWYFLDTFITVSAAAAEMLNSRSLVLKEVQDSRAAALDFYSLIRNAYLQHRDAEVHDHGEITRDTSDSLYYPDTEPAR
ncbi:MAG: MlaA family lipoprotein [Candidatus Binatia bacterium]